MKNLSQVYFTIDVVLLQLNRLKDLQTKIQTTPTEQVKGDWDKYKQINKWMNAYKEKPWKDPDSAQVVHLVWTRRRVNKQNISQNHIEGFTLASLFNQDSRSHYIYMNLNVFARKQHHVTSWQHNESSLVGFRVKTIKHTISVWDFHSTVSSFI